jgi:hypothetical protein
MGEYLLARTTRFLQGVGEHGEPADVKGAGREESLLIGGLSKSDGM